APGTIEVFPDTHDAAVVVLDAAAEIHFLGLHVLALGDEPEKGVPAAVARAAGGGKNAPVVKDRRRAALAADVAVVTPEQPAVLGGDGDDAGPQELDVLLHVAHLDRDGGGVPGKIEIRHRRLPNHRAVLLVEGRQGGYVPSRRADQGLAVNQGGFGVSPDV